MSSKLVLATLWLLCPLLSVRAEVLGIAGSAIASSAVADAARVVESRSGAKIEIAGTAGSASGIAALGGNEVQIAILSRAVEQEDRASYPDVVFNEIPFGVQAVALGASADVWNGGVRQITRAQLRDIYEKRVTNWKQIGGPDQKITFFNSEEGRGLWELFAKWIYGDTRQAPLGDFPTASNDEEARNSVEFTQGSFTLISPLLIDRKVIFPIALKADDGNVYYPTPAVIARGDYPMERPLCMVVNDKPTLNVKLFVDFMLGPEGENIVRKHGFLAMHDVPGMATPTPTPKPATDE